MNVVFALDGQGNALPMINVDGKTYYTSAFVDKVQADLEKSQSTNKVLKERIDKAAEYLSQDADDSAYNALETLQGR